MGRLEDWNPDRGRWGKGGKGDTAGSPGEESRFSFSPSFSRSPFPFPVFAAGVHNLDRRPVPAIARGNTVRVLGRCAGGVREVLRGGWDGTSRVRESEKWG